MKLFCVSITILILYSVSIHALSSAKSLEEIEKLENEYLETIPKTKTKKLTAINKNKQGLRYKPIRNVAVPKLAGNTLWKGWVKFFHYDYDNAIKAPDTFYKNPFYSKQKILVAKKEDKDTQERNMYIPTIHHFWAKLLKTGNLNILSNRHNEETNLADTITNLNTESIKYVHPKDNANGAVQDLGHFKEGNCLSISTLKPDPKKNRLFNSRTEDGQDQTWVICTDKKKDKDQLMGFLIALKLEYQKLIEEDLVEKQVKGISNTPKYASQLLNPKVDPPRIRRGGPSANDGYLILLQDWSPCSVKCGGGISTQQWLCVPPVNKGRPCPGGAIIERKCGKKPCPGITKGGLLKPPDKNHVTLTPIYKAMPFSSRPQNFVQCEIKESDVLYKTKEYDPEHKVEVKVPARLVMNTKTISVFGDDSYETAKIVFQLNDTTVAISTKDPCCMYLTSQNREIQVCSMGKSCGTRQDPKFVNEWRNDMAYFLAKCNKPLETTDLNAKNPFRPIKVGPQNTPSGSGISVEMTIPQQTQQSIVRKKKQFIRKEIKNTLQKEMDKKVDQTQKISLTALRREINLEDMIKKEEVQKGQEKTEELVTQVQQEKKKKEVLKKALTIRKESYKQIQMAKQTKFKMDDIKHDTKIDIKFKRAVLKKKIEQIRTKFRRKHRALQQQILKIRSEMAEDIMAANKKGNSDICKKSRKDMKLISEYCDQNEPYDYMKNQTCKDGSGFCYVCCEHEFGDMHIEERDDCQSMCDKEEQNELDNGDWIWTEGKAPTSA